MRKMIAKVNKSRSLFFERINKTDKSLARLLKKKVNKSRNEKGDVTTDFTEIRDYYEYCMPVKWTTGRNGQILRKIQLSKTEPGRIRKY